MDDREIVALYWQRDERALRETEARCGAYCRALAERILRDPETARECVNDAYLRAWNAIPPERPNHLRAFLAKLTRNLALDRLRAETAGKRGGGTVEAVLDELGEIADVGGAEDEVLARELGAAVSRFVRSLPPREGDIFVRRCFFAEDTADIARRCGLRANTVAASLSRTRKKLKAYLMEEGYL